MRRRIRLIFVFGILGLPLFFAGCVVGPFIPHDTGSSIQIHPSRSGGGYIINSGVSASFGRGYVSTGGGYGTESGYRMTTDKKGNSVVTSYSIKRRR